MFYFGSWAKEQQYQLTQMDKKIYTHKWKPFGLLVAKIYTTAISS
jgi:hypothetical protein